MQGAIFDIDGTLLDSMATWNNATTLFYTRRDLTLTAEEFEFFKSVTLNESFPYIKARYNLPMTLEEIQEEFSGIILNEYKYNIPIKPYADEYLRFLKASDVKLACATSTKAEYCIPAFKRLGIFELFDTFTYSDEVSVNKSKPDVYLLAAKRLGLNPCDCTVFEDISIGIKSAKSAGFKTCAVFDKTNENETDILKSEADNYIKSWKELLR